MFLKILSAGTQRLRADKSTLEATLAHYKAGLSGRPRILGKSELLRE